MAQQQAPWGEYAKWLAGEESGSYYNDLLNEATTRPARDATRKKILKAYELPWENSPHGLLKHLVNESMNARCEIVDDKYTWKPEDRVQRFDWEQGDVVYIPPNTISQHFNADPTRPARIIVVTNRIYKQCGLNDLEQIETAPEYNPNEKLTAERLRRYLQVPLSR